MAWFWGRGAAARAAEEEERMRRRTRPRPDRPVVVHILGEHSLDILHARDISETGIGVFVAHGFEPRDLEQGVEIVVALPGERSFLARGQVKHRSQTKPGSRFFGVQFTRITDPQRERIRRYVESRLAEEEAAARRPRRRAGAS